MKKILTKLNIYYSVALFTFVTTVIIVLGMIPLFLNKWGEIPQGVILGSLVGILAYLILGIVEGMDEKKKKVTITIIVMAARFLLIGLTIALAATLYYYKGYKIFNVFAVLGGYLLTTLWLLILNLMSKKV